MIKYDFASEAISAKPGYVIAFETKNGIQRQDKLPKITQMPNDKCDQIAYKDKIGIRKQHKQPRTSVIKYNFPSEASSVKPGYFLAFEIDTNTQRQV